MTQSGLLGGEGLQVGSARRVTWQAALPTHVRLARCGINMSPCLSLLLTHFSELQVLYAHTLVGRYTHHTATHTHYTSPREHTPSYTETHRSALYARALLHTCSHRPKAPSHTHTPSRAYVFRPTDMARQPSCRDIYACAQQRTNVCSCTNAETNMHGQSETTCTQHTQAHAG